MKAIETKFLQGLKVDLSLVLFLFLMSSYRHVHNDIHNQL